LIVSGALGGRRIVADHHREDLQPKANPRHRFAVISLFDRQFRSIVQIGPQMRS